MCLCECVLISSYVTLNIATTTLGTARKNNQMRTESDKFQTKKKKNQNDIFILVSF